MGCAWNAAGDLVVRGCRYRSSGRQRVFQRTLKLHTHHLLLVAIFVSITTSLCRFRYSEPLAALAVLRRDPVRLGAVLSGRETSWAAWPARYGVSA